MAIFREYDSGGKDRSAEDRRRHRELVEESIKKNIGGIIAEESIIGQSGSKKIKIPIRGIKEFQFIYGKNISGAGGGDGTEKRGDVLGEDGDKGSGAGGAGTQEGEDIFETEITIEELINYLFDDLDLPDLDRRKLSEAVKESGRRKLGFQKKGIPPRLAKRRSAVEKIKRRQGYLRDHGEARQGDREDEPSRGLCQGDGSPGMAGQRGGSLDQNGQGDGSPDMAGQRDDSPDQNGQGDGSPDMAGQRGGSLDPGESEGRFTRPGELGRLSQRGGQGDGSLDMAGQGDGSRGPDGQGQNSRGMERFPFMEDDLRYHRVKETKKKEFNAVVICIMDVSGSMDQTKKYMARSFYFLLYQFLRLKYSNVEVVFIAHTTVAKEVSELEFFHKGESGGTYISSGYDKALEIIEQRYSPASWNIYAFHCSDGDNWTEDNKKAVELAQKLCEVCNLFGYGEISPGYYISSSTIKTEFQKNVKSSRFVAVTMSKKEDILACLKKLLNKDSEQE